MGSVVSRLVDVQVATGHGELVTSRRGVPYLLGTRFNVCWFDRSGFYKVFRRGSNVVVGRSTTVEGVKELLKLAAAWSDGRVHITKETER